MGSHRVGHNLSDLAAAAAAAVDKWRGGIYLEIGIDIHTLLYIKQITSKDLLYNTGNSLVVQWLELCALIDKGPGSIPGQGTKIP